MSSLICMALHGMYSAMVKQTRSVSLLIFSMKSQTEARFMWPVAALYGIGPRAGLLK